MRRRENRGLLTLMWILVGAVLVMAVLIMMTIIAKKNREQEEVLRRAQQEYEIRRQEEEERIAAEEHIEELRVINVLDNPSSLNTPLADVLDVQNGEIQGSILLTPADFQQRLQTGKSVTKDRGLYAAADSLHIPAGEKDILVLQFSVYADALTMLRVDCGSISNYVLANQIPTTICIPVSGLPEIDQLQFYQESGTTPIYLDSMYLVNYGQDTPIDQIAKGYFQNKPVPLTQIRQEQVLGWDCKQCLVKDDIMFVLANQQLIAYRRENGKYVNLGSISDLGTTNDMAFTQDKTAIVVVSKQEGLYTIDISDPSAMKKLGSFDSQDAAWSLVIDGDYAFICERYAGVTVVNISDLTAPTYVTKIAQGADYRGCCVDEGRLYAAANANRRIDIYDIRNLGDVKLLGKVALDGAGQGVAVRNGILYAATCLNSGYNDLSELWSFGRGTGNGLTIYDVKNPQLVKLLGAVKFDGVQTSMSADAWDIQLAGNYAFVTSTYKGVYVVDVENPEVPTTVQQYKYEKEKRQTLENGEEKITREKSMIMHTTLLDEKALLSINWGGVAEIQCPYAKKPEERTAGSYRMPESSEQILVNAETCEVEQYQPEGCVWSVEVTENAVFLANGIHGIQKLNRELELLETMPSSTSVKDVAVQGDILAAAESEAGISLYRIGTALTKISSWKGEKEMNCSAIEISPDGTRLLVQDKNNGFHLLDISNPYAPVEIETTIKPGTMPARNIIKGDINGAIGIYGSAGMYLYSGNEWTNVDTSFYGEYDGIAVSDGKITAVDHGGISCIDLETGEHWERMKQENQYLRGKCATNGELMVITDPIGRAVYLFDIENPEEPQMIEKISVQGYLDIPVIVGDEIYIPCRYSGLLRLTRKPIE